MSKLKVGDRVKILDGATIYDSLQICWMNSCMNSLIGLETFVTKIYGRYVLLNIDAGHCCYAEYWLELVED